MPEIPPAEFGRRFYFVQQVGNGVEFRFGPEPVAEDVPNFRRRAVVRNDEIHRVSQAFESPESFFDFVRGRRFRSPPVLSFLPVLPVGRFGSSHREELLPAEFVRVSATKVEYRFLHFRTSWKRPVHDTDFATEGDSPRKAFEKVEIFVVPVDEKRRPRLFRKPGEPVKFLRRRDGIENEPEIP